MRDATFEDVDSMLAITTPIKALAFQLQSRAEIDMGMKMQFISCLLS